MGGVSGHDVSEVGLDEAGFADHAVVEQFDELAVGRQEPRPHRLHQEQAAFACGVDHPTSLGGVQRERLLAEHVLARLQEHERVAFVARRRRGDVHDVDQRVRSQILIAAVCVRHVEALARMLAPDRPISTRPPRGWRHRPAPGRWRTRPPSLPGRRSPTARSSSRRPAVRLGRFGPVHRGAVVLVVRRVRVPDQHELATFDLDQCRAA